MVNTDVTRMPSVRKEDVSVDVDCLATERTAAKVSTYKSPNLSSFHLKVININ